MLVYRKSDQLPETQPHGPDSPWIEHETNLLQGLERLRWSRK